MEKWVQMSEVKVDEIWDRNEQQQNLKRAITKRDEKVNCVQCMTQSYTKDTKREVPGENEGLFNTF